LKGNRQGSLSFESVGFESIFNAFKALGEPVGYFSGRLPGPLLFPYFDYSMLGFAQTQQGHRPCTPPPLKRRAKLFSGNY